MDSGANPKDGRKGRRARQVGVTVFILILASAMAGLLGKGPLSKVITQTPGAGLKTEHFRFIRYQSPADLKIQVGPQAASTGLVELRLSKAFVDEVEIDRIEPEPESQRAGPQYFTYAIRAEPNTTTEIRVRFASSHFGRLRYEVRAGEDALHLQHFAFP